MNPNRIDHISIAVKDLNQAQAVWQPVLGKAAPDEVYEDEQEKIRVARYYVGGVALELMESTSPDGEVAKFIRARGEGIMLLSLNVASASEAVDELKEKGYPMVGGLRPFRDGEYAFIHPRAMNGVLLEVIDDPSPSPGPPDPA